MPVKITRLPPQEEWPPERIEFYRPVLPDRSMPNYYRSRNRTLSDEFILEEEELFDDSGVQ